MTKTPRFNQLTQLILKSGALVILASVLIVAALSSFGCVEPGHRGVLITMGRVEPTVLGEGIYWKKPFVQTVVEVDVRTTAVTAETEASSRDLQLVGTKIVLNSHLDPGSVPRVYREIGLDFQNRIEVPAVHEALKQSTAVFTAEELITKRAEAKAHTLEALRARLQPLGIVVEDISITNFQFSKAFNEAIENKVTAEQLKLKADRDLERIRTEAEQVEAKAQGEKKAAIAKAQGEAEAAKIVSAQLQVSPSYIEWMKVNRWNGALPQVTGGATPLIQVK